MLPGLICALKQRGFNYLYCHESQHYFEGELGIQDGSTHQILMRIHRSFTSPPEILLKSVPRGGSSPLPHITPTGGFCYIDDESIVFDCFDPIAYTYNCLNKAAEVLWRIINGELDDDLKEEFYSVWPGSAAFADFETPNFGCCHAIFFRKDVKCHVLAITDDTDRTLKKLKSFGILPDYLLMPGYRIPTSASPKPDLSAWPPKTLGELLTWQQKLDPICRKKILERVLQGALAGKPACAIVIESPRYTYGFAVYYPKTTSGEYAPKRLKRKIAPQLEIKPLVLDRLDYNYISERNIPGLKTFANKRIAIVGCGTIGGYLADVLMKSGAGTNKGSLTLIDHGWLAPGNIGRHRLGFPALYSNKAKALVDELLSQAPTLRIVAIPTSALEANIYSYDLVIDATGDEALGHWLRQQLPPNTASLSVWVEGEGVAVRALLWNSPGDACARCLFEANRQNRLRAVNEPIHQIRSGHGCEGLYVAYPATVSLHAAVLAGELALDWVNNKPSPKLRTRVLNSNFTLATPDCSPPAEPGCPSCNS
ncbi:thiF family protein [Desulfovibrio sp. A2]|nr:thiF family protein [Desulfovibrio sp. A2]